MMNNSCLYTRIYLQNKLAGIVFSRIAACILESTCRIDWQVFNLVEQLPIFQNLSVKQTGRYCMMKNSCLYTRIYLQNKLAGIVCSSIAACILESTSRINKQVLYVVEKLPIYQNLPLEQTSRYCIQQNSCLYTRIYLQNKLAVIVFSRIAACILESTCRIN